jgi:Transglycosylase SLT domain
MRVAYRIATASLAALAATVSGTSTAASTSSSSAIQNQVRAASGLSDDQFTCLSYIIARESGWNPQATSSASGAYGLFQALPGSKMASAGADWRTNPATQTRWGVSYMKSRYGSPCGAWRFWQAHSWY